jgi:hypothetical protein
MKETLVRMCHTTAFAMELGFKAKKNTGPLLAETPGSKAAYVVSLDRQLDKLK